MTNTPCKNCVFAVYEDKTQKDCRFKMLDIYEQTGTRIIAAYDQDAEFFVIEDRVCPLARGVGWYGQHKDHLIDQLKKELTYNFNVVMMMPKTEDQLACSITKILDNSSQPETLTLVKMPSDKGIDCKNVLESFAIPKWKIRATLEDIDPKVILKNIVQLTKNNIYVLIENHDNLPDNLLDKINQYGIYGANRFGAIFGDGISIVYRNEYLRAYYLDDPNVEVLDKLKEEPDVYAVVPLEEVINYEGSTHTLTLSNLD